MPLLHELPKEEQKIFQFKSQKINLFKNGKDNIMNEEIVKGFIKAY